MAKIIGRDEVRRSPRGRRATYDAELADLFANLGDEVAVLADEFGQVAKPDRPNVRNAILRAWSAVRDDKPRIEFSPEGEPQVYARS